MLNLGSEAVLVRRKLGPSNNCESVLRKMSHGRRNRTARTSRPRYLSETPRAAIVLSACVGLEDIRNDFGSRGPPQRGPQEGSSDEQAHLDEGPLMAARKEPFTSRKTDDSGADLTQRNSCNRHFTEFDRLNPESIESVRSLMGFCGVGAKSPEPYS